jgi:parallel beta-helix repeat protein
MNMNRLWRAVVTVPSAALLTTGVAFVSPAAAQSPTAALHCGSVVTQSTVLTYDVGPCTGTGLTVAASNVTLDLGGHSVFGALGKGGTATNNSLGIEVKDASNSTVTNGSVYNFAAGVVIDGGGADTVTGVKAHDNIGPSTSNYGDGVDVISSNGNTVDNNTVTHNGPYSGISLLTDSNNNLVRGNTVTDNDLPGADFGIRVEGPNATHNTVDTNTVSGSGSNGITVEPSCSNPFSKDPNRCSGDIPNEYNTVTNNTSDGNGFVRHAGSGINLFAMGIAPPVLEPTLNTVTGNTTNGNYSDGIDVEGGVNPGVSGGSNHNTVTGNTSYGNGNDGVEVAAGATDNTVNSNTADKNTNDGVAVGPLASGNTLTSNEGSGNGTYDGADYNSSCDSNTWSNNMFVKVNQTCVS